MNVHELTKDQLEELKGNYLTEKMDAAGEWPSWGELAAADELVSDEEVFEHYDGTDFVNDDFSCTAGLSDELFDADARSCRKIIREYAENYTVEDVERNASALFAS